MNFILTYTFIKYKEILRYLFEKIVLYYFYSHHIYIYIYIFKIIKLTFQKLKVKILEK